MQSSRTAPTVRLVEPRLNKPPRRPSPSQPGNNHSAGCPVHFQKSPNVPVSHIHSHIHSRRRISSRLPNQPESAQNTFRNRDQRAPLVAQAHCYTRQRSFYRVSGEFPEMLKLGMSATFATHLPGPCRLPNQPEPAHNTFRNQDQTAPLVIRAH